MKGCLHTCNGVAKLASFFLGPIAQRLEQRTRSGRCSGNAAVVRCKFGERPACVSKRPNAERNRRKAGRVEAIITHLSRWRYGEGMVQTTHLVPRAAKAEVVSIILWFWVRIPVGPPKAPIRMSLEHEIQNYISAFAHKTDEELMRETHRWVAHSEQHIAAKILIEQRRKAKEKAQEELEQLRHSEIQRQLEELKRPHWTVLPNFWLTFASAIAAVIAAYLGWLALKATTSAPPSPTPPTATSPIKPVAKQPATPTKP